MPLIVYIPIEEHLYNIKNESFDNNLWIQFALCSIYL